MKTLYYVQCELRKGDQVDHSWVEVDKAILNGVATVKRGEEWEEGWVISTVYPDVELTAKEIILHRDAHKTQRKASDV
jgi:hypothetical protein